MVELQEYIVSIDKERYNILTNEFREKYFALTIEEVKKYSGKIFLAIEDNKAIGLIVGFINNDEENTFSFKSPKRGRISELVVSNKCRSKGIGKNLLDRMEDYFRDVGCEAVLIEVFGHNERGRHFYNKQDYFERNIEVMKLL